MKAILLHDQYVTPNDREALVTGIVQIGEQLGGVGGLSVDVGTLDGDRLGKLPTGQVNSAATLNSLPVWYNSSLVVVATGLDLGHRDMNYLFGQSSMGKGRAVFSTHRLKGNALAIIGVEVHELGHAFGLVDRREQRYDRISRFAGHCVNDCIMRPANNLQEMLQGADRISRLWGTSGFCDGCADHLHKVHIAL